MGASREILEVVARSAVVYAFILAAVRLLGKREAGQLSPYDLVLLLLLSNAVQNAMVGPSTSLGAGLAAAATLLAMNLAVARLVLRGGRLATTLRGSPTMLVHDGHLVPEHLRREGLTLEDLNQALREHGVPEISDVHLAVLEVDGTISVLRREDVKDTSQHRRRVRILQRHTEPRP